MAKQKNKRESPQESKKESKKGNTYDKILKENFRELVVPLVFRQEGIDPVRSEPLPEEINSTINRKIDFLMRILEKNEQESIVHIEFQTRMPRSMLYRMAEYHGFLLAKYKLPIRHFVVYLGNAQTRARTELPNELHFSGYKLIALNQIPFENLIQSNIPEEIILAIFAHYPKHNPERVARIILYRLKEVCKDEASLRKFITQLTLLSQLRNLDGAVNKIVENMPITIDLRENAMVKKLLEEVEQELHQEKQERQQAEQERLHAEQERQYAEQERQQAEQERQHAVLQAEQERQERLQAEQTIKHTIFHLHQQGQLSAEQIANIMQLELEIVVAVLEGEE
jgi:hypothetical protein